MKSILKLTSTSLAIIILLGLHSCSSDEGIFTETEIITTEEVIFINNTAMLNTVNGTSVLNAFLITCPTEDGNTFTQTVLYGEDLEIDETGEIFADKAIFVQYWISNNRIFEPGEFLTEGMNFDSLTGESSTRFYNLSITLTNNEEALLGSFETVDNSVQDTFPPISGNFLVTPIFCDSPGPDLERLAKFATGRATFDSEILVATNGLCNEVYADQDPNLSVSFFLLGGAQEIDLDGDLKFENEDIEFIIFSDINEIYEVGATYPATVVREPLEFLEDASNPDPTISQEEAEAMGQPIWIRYTSLSDAYNTGELLDIDMVVIGEFVASVFPCQ